VAAPALVAAATSEIPVFGMLGLGAGQSATVHLVLVQPPDPTHPGCRITASFVDARGQVFRDATGKPFEQTFVLRDNVASALTLRSTDILTTGERRKPTRVLLAEPDDGTASDCTCLVATEELSGPRGRTDLSIYGARPPGGGNPPPPPICTATTR
jgi:hypothetical protein